jgi:hypothetical protein
MVDKVKKKGDTVYLCELCGYGYKLLETAEDFEEYCDTHGTYSPDIHAHSIAKPTVRVMQLAA